MEDSSDDSVPCVQELIKNHEVCCVSHFEASMVRPRATRCARHSRLNVTLYPESRAQRATLREHVGRQHGGCGAPWQVRAPSMPNAAHHDIPRSRYHEVSAQRAGSRDAWA